MTDAQVLEEIIRLLRPIFFIIADPLPKSIKERILVWTGQFPECVTEVVSSEIFDVGIEFCTYSDIGFDHSKVGPKAGSRLALLQDGRLIVYDYNSNLDLAKMELTFHQRGKIREVTPAAAIGVGGKPPSLETILSYVLRRLDSAAEKKSRYTQCIKNRRAQIESLSKKRK